MNSFSAIPTAVGRTTLNPNAAEFVPVALRGTSALALVSTSEENKSLIGENCDKAGLNRTDSVNSSASDDECRQYWRSQLPEDITPDFDALGLAFDGLEVEESVPVVSVLDRTNSFSTATKSIISGETFTRNQQARVLIYDKAQKQNTAQGTNSTFSRVDPTFAASQHSNGRSSAFTQVLGVQSNWEHQSLASIDQPPGLRDRQLTMNDNKTVGFLNESVGEPAYPEELGDMDPVDFLINEFPGFAAESLADIYHANSGDLNLTIEMLTQLELQEDVGSPLHLQPKSSSSPTLTLMEFPALSSPELISGLPQFHGEHDFPHSVNIQRTAEAESFFARPGASGNLVEVARNDGAHHAVHWQYERNGAQDFTSGISRTSSQSLGLGSFAGDSRVANEQRLEHYSQTCHARQLAPQIWLDSGETVANIYSELREESWDRTGIRNVYFEQARQAYLVGNRALAKELSAKGQWHNGLMKAAHSKAGDAIFWQRNLPAAQAQGLLQGQTGLVDLHGLHVTEAIPLLKRELAALRVAARSTRQRQQVFICVGTGNQMKGSRIPARLPVAVEQYLAEERLHFTEPQPGMLCVVLN